jgi:AcrR family transcriptional regulator
VPLAHTGVSRYGSRVLTTGDMLRAVTPVEGGAAFPASWPSTARSKLLAAMAGGVAARGFARTSVDDVLDLARASRRTFYVHFENREDCLASAHDAIRRDLLAMLEAAGCDLEATLDGVLRYFAAWPTHAHVVTTEIVTLGPAGIERHERLASDVARHLRGCAGLRWRTTGRLTHDDLAHAHVAALFRLVQHRVNTQRADLLADMAPDLAQVMRRAVAV